MPPALPIDPTVMWELRYSFQISIIHFFNWITIFGCPPDCSAKDGSPIFFIDDRVLQCWHLGNTRKQYVPFQGCVLERGPIPLSVSLPLSQCTNVEVVGIWLWHCHLGDRARHTLGCSQLFFSWPQAGIQAPEPKVGSRSSELAPHWTPDVARRFLHPAGSPGPVFLCLPVPKAA